MKKFFIKKSSSNSNSEQRNGDELAAPRLTNCLASGTGKSVIFLTTHKCASTFVSKLLTTLCNNSDYTHVNYAKALWRMGSLEGAYEAFLEKHYERLFFRSGEIYGPQRSAITFPGIQDFKLIFFLRDPRDVLVSAFHSFGRTHGIPKNRVRAAKFLEERSRIETEGVNRFALRSARDWILPAFKAYQELRVDSQDELYLTYDEYRKSPDIFIRKIADFIGLSIDIEKTNQLGATANPVATVPNPDAHQRSGRSGQYLSEWDPLTISEINDLLGEQLAYWRFC